MEIKISMWVRLNLKRHVTSENGNMVAFMVGNPRKKKTRYLPKWRKEIHEWQSLALELILFVGYKINSLNVIES